MEYVYKKIHKGLHLLENIEKNIRITQIEIGNI